MTETAAAKRQSNRFMLLYALAAAGGATAYVPFLTLLLPVRVSELAGTSDVQWLAYIALAGAITASLANIGFGWLSDKTRNRRGWISAGLVLSCILLINVKQATDLASLIAIIMLWQVSLNMMLAPLTAWAGDCVPDAQKGFLGGLLSFAPACGALAGAFVTIPAMANADVRLLLVAGIVAACVLPVLIAGPTHTFPELMKAPSNHDAAAWKAKWRFGNLVSRMWLARLLIQIAEAALFAYLYFWFRSISPEFGDNDAARIFSIVLLLSVPLTLATGRWADRHEKPILPLAVCAGLTCCGLLLMAIAQDLPAAIAGYVLFGIASGIFLAIHSAQTLRILPDPQKRGRDLGIFNLTNTVPSVIMPGLTLALVPVFGFPGLFLLFAVLALVACLLLAISPR